jgi:hypothetical protein
VGEGVLGEAGGTGVGAAPWPAGAGVAGVPAGLAGVCGNFGTVRLCFGGVSGSTSGPF